MNRCQNDYLGSLSCQSQRTAMTRGLCPTEGKQKPAPVLFDSYAVGGMALVCCPRASQQKERSR